MADSDSDGEFERFLQEDEDSLSPEPVARRSKHSGVYTSSSASAVTAAAAALLASSKLTTSKNKNKSSNKKKSSKRSFKTQLSDSEEAPPSYYHEYSTGRGAGLGNSDADPYAFDMTSPAIPIFTKEEEDSGDNYEKKKKEFQTLAKKAVAKSAPISMEDRIAQILQRTGSTQFQNDDKSDEDAVSDKESDKKEATEPPGRNEEKTTSLAQVGQDINDKDTGHSDSDAGRSSMSDSLGMVSADFEVRLLPPKPSLNQTRLSVSSSDSENFAVNRDALTDDLATPSRYEQQQMTFLKSEPDEDSTTERDEYRDDDFELDHTMVEEEDKEEGKESPPPYSPANERLPNKSEETFVSEFDKMKALLFADPVPALADAPSKQTPDDSERQDFNARNPQLYPGSVEMQQKSLDASDTFGYGDDEFEETLRSRQEEDFVPAKSEGQKIHGTYQSDIQATLDPEYSGDYEDDAFEAEHDISNTDFHSAPSEPPHVITEDKQDSINDLVIDKSSKVDALLSKYGDFYTQSDEEEPTTKELSNEGTQQKVETREISDQTSTGPDPTGAVSHTLNAPTETANSPPSSPPPPPPPADENEDDQELQRFTLNGSTGDTTTQVQPVVTQYSVLTVPARGSHGQPLSTADKFRQIENQVAALRFVQPAGTPSLAPVTSPSSQSVHPVSSNILVGHRDLAQVTPPSPFMEPISISFDASLLAEEEDTQREFDEFVRSSQIMRQEKRVAAQRASIARENGLVLRLQQAQRQILQLKEHIQATSGPPELGDGTPKQADAEVDEGKRNDKELHTARGESSSISKAAYNKLRKEIKTQDNLIAAFQKENERLMQQLKQVRQDVHYDVHEANEELRRQIKMLQDQLGEAATLGGGGDLTSKAQYRVAVEARLEAEAHAMALQEELASVRLSYQQKLNEVTLELDRVKKAKVELECHYEGVDLTQVAQDTQQVRELQNELELCKKEHTHVLAALQKKLDWYVENQRLLDDQDEELRRLRLHLAAQPSKPTPSKDQRNNSKAGGPSPARSHRRSPNDIRRIQELESRLAELEEAMRRRHPDSLANLILASRRADEESKTHALERNYEEKLAALSRELEQAHEASETKLASFRQQQEKLMLQYRRKIKEQEKQLKQLSKAPLSHRPTSKDTNTTSDPELVKVRRFYTDKIKELERKWEAKYRSLRKQQYSGLGSKQQVQEGLTYAESAVVIANLQRQIREQELELKQEKARVEQLEAESQLVNSLPEDSATEDIKSKQTRHDKHKELEDQVADLKAQLEDSESARARLAQTLTTLQTVSLAQALNSNPTPTAAANKSKPAMESVVSQQIEAELAQLKQDLTRARDELSNEHTTASDKIDQLEKQIAEHIEKNSKLEAQLAGNQLEMQSLQRLAVESERHSLSLEVQVQRVPELEEEVLSLRRELELPRTPSMVEYRSLELKVATLEQKHKLREAELKVVLDRALASTRLEQLSREHAHRAAIAAKNAEIASFKRQLEEILDELALLQSAKALNQPEDDGITS